MFIAFGKDISSKTKGDDDARKLKSNSFEQNWKKKKKSLRIEGFVGGAGKSIENKSMCK